MSRIVIDEERCKGCLLCAQVCPKAIIAASSRFNAKGYKVADRKSVV
jgi:2-oxoglutarate ferredoxin oxidoreductase subunit delta